MENPPKYFNNFSKDYEKLYELLCEGFTMFAFVSYPLNDKKNIFCQDICKIIKRKDFDIDFYVRGRSYAHIDDYFKDTHTEKELFLRECQRLSVEWITNESNE